MSLRPMVIGAAGLLGSALVRRLEPEHPETIAATRAEADVTDRFRLEAEVERLGPTHLINCAAYTDVDGCTRNPERARAINALGAENVARAAAGAGCRTIQISTDFVFDGRARRPYVETDAPAPLSEYGRSKLDGERRVAAATADHLIVRTAWLYGHRGGGFVTAIRRRAEASEPLRVVTDQTGSPTFADDLADGIARLLATGATGIVHLVNRGACSRLELAEAIVEDLGLGDRVRITGVTSREIGAVAERPAFSALDTGLYERLTGHAPRPWREALRWYIRGGSMA
jgi:dTDP-4-dehydrorhamnose reductase